jgi:hypothetical protein
MIELSYTFGTKRYSISRDSIIAAMRTFDRRHHKSVARTGTKYFVWWRGRAYPPKAILRGLQHGPTGHFSGGITTNQVFTDLEFYVGNGKFPTRLRDSYVVLPSLTRLKKRLLNQRWAKLQHNFLAGEDGKYPGVYLFAFSRLDVTGKPIQLNDVFYVGSSCTGLNARLNQFFKGHTRDCCHSAAMRFYRRWRTRATHGQSFSWLL